MIIEVRADDDRFRTVRFSRGMNVILAERMQAASEKDSRNGLGKSTLIEIIHFCLGSSPSRDDLLRQEPIVNWTFEMDLEVMGLALTVRRSPKTPNKILVTSPAVEAPFHPTFNQEADQQLSFDREVGQSAATRDQWSNYLGWAMFGLPVDRAEHKYAPTFRSLISYFVRRGQGAYLTPFAHHPSQKEWDRQINSAFLLGLNWQHVSKWQSLKDRDNEVKQLQKAMTTGLAAHLLGTLGSMESARVRLDREIRREETEIAQFRVHPRYRQIEEQTNRLTFEIRDLSNANVIDQGILDLYVESIEVEEPADRQDVARIYAEAGIVLSDKVVKRLEEVQEFHNEVASNRRSYLQGEMARLRSDIARRSERIENLVTQRSQLMNVLQSHGALEEYNRLVQLHGAKVAELEDLDQRIELRHSLEREASAIRIEKEQLRLDARIDLDDRRTSWEEAIADFNSNSEVLYESPGELMIDLREGGFKFEVQIERSGSHGIDHMKIFCYDLMLAQTWSTRQQAPGFLVHDSIIYDGVDERQKAKALELAAQESDSRGFQYICCLNSDMVPYHEFSSAFRFDSYVRLTLTDATPDGGLLGIRL